MQQHLGNLCTSGFGDFEQLQCRARCRQRRRVNRQQSVDDATGVQNRQRHLESLKRQVCLVAEQKKGAAPAVISILELVELDRQFPVGGLRSDWFRGKPECQCRHSCNNEKTHEFPPDFVATIKPESPGTGQAGIFDIRLLCFRCAATLLVAEPNLTVIWDRF